jgi:hypothetical protein
MKEWRIFLRLLEGQLRLTDGALFFRCVGGELLEPTSKLRRAVDPL